MTSYEALQKKKDNHKLMERQRRQDMKKLCLVLKSLLPPENLEGKRSLTDQLFASACYISDLEVKVAELKKKRDQLRILSDAERISKEKVCGVFPSVRISKVDFGIEVSVNAFKNQVKLSNLVEVLEGGGGIEVVSALVSAANDKVFYTLQCQVSDAGSFDCSVVYGRIWHLFNRKPPFGQ